MSGYGSFYRPRILNSVNIPQIEEGAIVGFISLYSIVPGVLIIAAMPTAEVPDASTVEEAPLSIDLALDMTSAIPVVAENATTP